MASKKIKAVKKKGKYTAPFTTTIKKAVIAAYQKGGTLEELAKSNKCSTAKIRRALIDGKVKMRPRGPKSDGKVVKASKPKVKAKKHKNRSPSRPGAGQKPEAVKARETAPAETKGLVDLSSVSKGRKELTPEQREAKNAKDRERRAAKKAGLNAAVADVTANLSA